MNEEKKNLFLETIKATLSFLKSQTFLIIVVFAIALTITIPMIVTQKANYSLKIVIGNPSYIEFGPTKVPIQVEVVDGHSYFVVNSEYIPIRQYFESLGYEVQWQEGEIILIPKS